MNASHEEEPLEPYTEPPLNLTDDDKIGVYCYC